MIELQAVPYWECFVLLWNYQVEFSNDNVLCFVLYLQGDENEDDNVDSQNGDHESSAQKNKLNVKTRKHLFNLTLVNSYGSADILTLEDNDKPLKITG